MAMLNVYKNDPYASYISTDICHMQVVFLNHLRESTEKIAEVTGYAISTVKNYVKKFTDLLDDAIEFFVAKVEKVLHTDLIKKGDCAYILHIYDRKDQLRFLKIGSTNDLTKRLKQIKYYVEEKWFSGCKIQVCAQYICKSRSKAYIVESALHEHYYNKDGVTYYRQDRYTGTTYDADDIANDAELQQFMSLCLA